MSLQPVSAIASISSEDARDGFKKIFENPVIRAIVQEYLQGDCAQFSWVGNAFFDLSHSIFQRRVVLHIDFEKDLAFFQKTILENHPGIFDTLNPDFITQMEKSCTVAEEQLRNIHTIDQKAMVLTNLGRSFHDAHLWIKYDCGVPKQSVPSNNLRFVAKMLKNDLLWIALPTFDEGQRPIFNEIASKLPNCRNKNIIFDLRGNGGGNFSLGIDLLMALFGKEYATDHLIAARSNLSIEWRVSIGNQRHMQDLIFKMFKINLNHPNIPWAEKVKRGIEKAILCSKPYYIENAHPHSMSGAVSLFKGKIVAIVDRGCGSSCLSFIDGLKEIEPRVLLVGEETAADTNYMELRKVPLPSGKGSCGFPINIFRNRSRGHNVPHIPDIQYQNNLQDTKKLQEFVLKIMANNPESD